MDDILDGEKSFCFVLTSYLGICAGYICCREFDRSSRRATKLSAALCNTNEDEAEEKTGKKRHMPDSSPNSVEDDDKYI